MIEREHFLPFGYGCTSLAHDGWNGRITSPRLQNPLTCLESTALVYSWNAWVRHFRYEEGEFFRSLPVSCFFFKHIIEWAKKMPKACDHKRGVLEVWPEKKNAFWVKSQEKGWTMWEYPWTSCLGKETLSVNSSKRSKWKNWTSLGPMEVFWTLWHGFRKIPRTEEAVPWTPPQCKPYSNGNLIFRIKLQGKKERKGLETEMKFSLKTRWRSEWLTPWLEGFGYFGLEGVRHDIRVEMGCE